jgi:hypothetical protein
MIRTRSLIVWMILLPICSAMIGCDSGRVPVTGKVVYPDGTPVIEGTVIGEGTVDGKPIGIQGVIRADGQFSLGTASDGDGVKPGNYRFVVMPPALGDSEIAEGKRPAVDGKYMNFESSKIVLEVVKAAKNELNITVTKPTK